MTTPVAGVALDSETVKTCGNCAGEGWVCENHEDTSWSADGCECGAGASCPVCNREMSCAPYIEALKDRFREIQKAEVAYRKVMDGRITGTALARYADLQKLILQGLPTKETPKTPVPGATIDEESAKLLRAGDVLRCINPNVRAHKLGTEYIFEERTHNEPGEGNDIRLQGSRLSTWSGVFAFVSRPDVPALTDEDERSIPHIIANHVADLEAQASAYKERVEAGLALIETLANAGTAVDDFDRGSRAGRLDSIDIIRRALLNGADR